MKFVHVYSKRESITEILRDVSHIFDCADEIKILPLDHGTRVEIKTDDPERFLKCARRKVSSDIYEGWEHQLEEAREDGDMSGPRGHDDR